MYGQNGVDSRSNIWVDTVVFLPEIQNLSQCVSSIYVYDFYDRHYHKAALLFSFSYGTSRPTLITYKKKV